MSEMKNKEVFVKPLNADNPILVQVLGICSALAVTSQLKPAIVMGLAVTIITAFSNLIISIIRLRLLAFWEYFCWYVHMLQ